MSTLLVDPAAAPDPGQPAAPDGAGQAAPPSGEPAAPSPAGRTCADCDAPIQEGQQWCLQCGAGQPGSLDERASWRPLAAVAVVCAALVAGAAVAAAAALDQHKTAPATVPVAQVPVPATPGATATTPGSAAPPAGGATAPSTSTGTTSQTPTSSSKGSLFPPVSSKPPKIPAPTTTPKSSGSTGSTGAGSTTTTPTQTGTSTTNTTAESKSTPKTEQLSPILLDTDAAQTYNPYHYPEARFGDPALAIDGETSTAWTAQVDPATAPRMAEGLLIDLRSPTALGSAEVRTDTPGMTVQVFGSSAAKLPASITAPGWTQLSSSRVLEKDAKLKLHAGGKSFRFLVLWIVKAPSASIGTAQAPGHVSLNEVVLFPPPAG